MPEYCVPVVESWLPTMSQSSRGLSGLVTSSANTSLPPGPAELTTTVCHSRRPVPAKSANTSWTTGEASTCAPLFFSRPSWVAGTYAHSSVPAGGSTPAANAEAKSWLNVPWASRFAVALP